ncbi:MAG TPA: YfiR family protein [Noviherbaspirillum sp.]|uniref:YfiR family protein n=1 Tax=Noviherbaspirillum sp. TaxID=1926288 RepID=UPI002D240417|nr:YfiR family protein [Noviherbaspirillum sp.]HYD93933.1 YfiR family protein [Noviherbaspirillum sp.]
MPLSALALSRSLLRLSQALLLLLPPAATAQPVPEYELKAAFVYNFALFTDWPADTAYDGGTLNICVNPSSALRLPLAGLGDKPVKGRRVAVRAFSGVESLRLCHVLFIDGSDRERWGQIKKGLGGVSVLTVSDDDQIIHDGSVIGLTMENNRIVFDVDTRAARQARLVLSSKLLRLARTVQ